MKFDELKHWANSAISANIRFASIQLGWQLPLDTVHCILVKGLSEQLLDTKKAIDSLLTGPKFPRVVDLAVRGIVGEKTLVVWIPSGEQKVEDPEMTWNEGFGPFKPVGIMIPSYIGKSPPLSRSSLEKMGRDWLVERSNT